MSDEIFIWILLLLSCPFAAYAMTPVLRLAYRLTGKKYRCVVQEVETRRLSSNPENQRALYQVSLRLRTDTGLKVTYAYRAISRGAPVVRAKADDELELYAMPWLVDLAGWRPQTAYTAGATLIDSIMIYATFFFFGGLSFIAAGYHLIFGGNFLFDLLSLLQRQ